MWRAKRSSAASSHLGVVAASFQSFASTMCMPRVWTRHLTSPASWRLGVSRPRPPLARYGDASTERVSFADTRGNAARHAQVTPITNHIKAWFSSE